MTRPLRLRDCPRPWPAWLKDRLAAEADDLRPARRLADQQDMPAILGMQSEFWAAIEDEEAAVARAPLVALLGYVRSLPPARSTEPQAPNLYGSDGAPQGGATPTIDVSASSGETGAIDLRLAGDQWYYWFALLVTADGQVVVPTEFRDEHGLVRSLRKNLRGGRQWSLTVPRMVEGTAYALASPSPFLRDPVREEDLAETLRSEVERLRRARRDLFFIEKPFGR